MTSPGAEQREHSSISLGQLSRSVVVPVGRLRVAHHHRADSLPDTNLRGVSRKAHREVPVERLCHVNECPRLFWVAIGREGALDPRRGRWRKRGLNGDTLVFHVRPRYVYISHVDVSVRADCDQLHGFQSWPGGAAAKGRRLS